MRVTPHVTQNTRRSAIDARTTRHPGYEISLSKRRLVEKTVRVVEANRAAEESEASRTRESELVIRVQLCSIQPLTHTQTAGAECMSAAPAAQGAIRRPDAAD